MCDNSYFHGSDSYVGHCPKCSKDNLTCYDGICEDCAIDEPVKCPECLDMVHPSHMTEHGCCICCLEYKAEEFTENTLIIMEVMS
jgi:hypothetical protein